MDAHAEAGAGHVAMAPRRVAGWRIFSWQMYDFADTIYSMNVTSLYFGPWIILAFGANSLVYGVITTIANLLVAVVSPLMGAMSDASLRRLPFQRFFAFGCAIATAAIAFSPNLFWAVLFFFISYVSYSAAGTFYQALLPGLAAPENVSRVSGIGVALGYAGSLAGMLAVQQFVPSDDLMVRSFVPTAALFILFALPGLYFVPDFAPATRKVKLDVAAAYRRVLDTIQHARQYRHLFRFLVADFIYENAVAAVIFNMSVYSRIVLGFTGDDLIVFLGTATVVAIVWAAIYGPITDRIGPKPAVLIMLGIWLVTFPLVALTRSQAIFFYVIGPLAGMGLGSTWVASRTYLIALTPVEKSGEFFGLYALSGKSAGVVGLAAWTAVLFILKPFVGEVIALQSAAAAMGLFTIAGLWLVLGLPAVRPTSVNMLQR